jgi:hypothetical protein
LQHHHNSISHTELGRAVGNGRTALQARGGAGRPGNTQEAQLGAGTLIQDGNPAAQAATMHRQLRRAGSTVSADSLSAQRQHSRRRRFTFR